MINEMECIRELQYLVNELNKRVSNIELELRNPRP